MKPKISIIIPTLNEENGLRETLNSLQHFKEAEILVVDGGSSDSTISIAEEFNVRVIRSPRGRGIQLHAGAVAARADIFWFLHADTIAPPDALGQIIEILQNPSVAGGNFTLHFDGISNSAKFMTWLYPNLRKIGLIYGDSGIFVRRENYKEIGGFKPLPLFEDLDLIYRLQAVGLIITLSSKITTSSRRFEGRSFTLTFLRWIIFQILFWLGVSPYRLAEYYYPIRK